MKLFTTALIAATTLLSVAAPVKASTLLNARVENFKDTMRMTELAFEHHETCEVYAPFIREHGGLQARNAKELRRVGYLTDAEYTESLKLMVASKYHCEGKGY